MIVMKENMGDYKKEFARLHDYAEMLKSTNPGTTVVIRTSKDSVSGKEVFMGIYVCLEALKTGWLEGCRNIIGFDGAFLKGTCKGELLSCISKDGNNQMFPVAWAVVEKESKDTWSWFIRCLKHDLNLTETEGEGLTVMSDMQKGLHLAITQLLPNAEMRWCARHIWANWKQTWPGEERRKKFWQCARATFEVYFSKKLDEMDQLGGNIVQDLMKYNKETWCRAYFKDHSKCDVVENNMCETFNSWILAARHKSIITMLEEIRIKCMERMNSMREFSKKWVGEISPMAMEILGENAQRAAKCEVEFNGETGYEIQDGPYKHVVDFRAYTCTCRSWQLKGIPCAHAITAMHYKNYEVEPYVDHWYRKDTYLKAYSRFIQPLTSMNLWPTSTLPAIEPPVITAMPGRPKKKRTKAADEPKKKFGKEKPRGKGWI
ncbi:PREDICTED: uncharacterized protein LOC109232679 [Nicotiana attenuata]|uniref:uncharacterized protein LOC109232679 n=1 Tax=Nicotiana attenuata TaxID=49451 RepID=UPI000905AFC1|nr:PREDICTED: uncharacterized protein LOC109232679 [Nicotiana attenuata]